MRLLTIGIISYASVYKVQSQKSINLIKGWAPRIPCDIWRWRVSFKNILTGPRGAIAFLEFSDGSGPNPLLHPRGDRLAYVVCLCDASA